MTFWFWRKYRSFRKEKLRNRRVNNLKQISLGRQLIKKQEDMIEMQKEVINNLTEMVEKYKKYHEQTEFSVTVDQGDWTDFKATKI